MRCEKNLWIQISLLSVFISFSGNSSLASLLRIIHTNDLHSHLDHSSNPDRGGYAAVKAVIERLKSEANDSHIETLVLDAGDFSEGSEFYFADAGAHSFRAIDSMGYDVVAMGNHDWLMGIPRLNQLLELTDFKTPLVAANFTCSRFHEVNQRLRPYREFVKGYGSDRSRIAVLGLTTDDSNYAWRAWKDCVVETPLAVAQKWLPTLRKRNDFVIALTHLGVSDDRKLIQGTSGIDLIVGGHSHTELFAPDLARSRSGKLVPIVQAGRHGDWVGDLLVDLTPGSQLQVLSYKLVPVYNSEVESKGQLHVAVREVQSRVELARNALEQNYGRDWLEGVWGFSDVKIESPISSSTEWGDYFANALRWSADADVGFTVSSFDGYSRPAGLLKRIDLMTIFPRMFETERPLGWSIWSATVPGFFVRTMLDRLMEQGESFSISGISVTTVRDKSSGRYIIKDVRRGSRGLQPFDDLRVAFPEGIVRGALESQPILAGLVMKSPLDTRIPVWSALARYARVIGGTLRAYPASQRKLYFNAGSQ